MQRKALDEGIISKIRQENEWLNVTVFSWNVFSEIIPAARKDRDIHFINLRTGHTVYICLALL
jgi:hypothetical protein